MFFCILPIMKLLKHLTMKNTTNSNSEFESKPEICFCHIIGEGLSNEVLYEMPYKTFPETECIKKAGYQKRILGQVSAWTNTKILQRQPRINLSKTLALVQIIWIHF